MLLYFCTYIASLPLDLVVIYVEPRAVGYYFFFGLVKFVDNVDGYLSSLGLM